MVLVVSGTIAHKSQSIIRNEPAINSEIFDRHKLKLATAFLIGHILPKL